MNQTHGLPKEEVEDTPPFFKTWRAMYFFVAGNLAAIIILLYLFTAALNE